MSFQFIEVDPAEVQMNQEDLELDDGYVYEHLKRQHLTTPNLPAIKVEVEGHTLRAVGGHKYLAIARDLGRERIRAVIHNTTFEDLKNARVRGLLRAIPNDELANETYERSQHVIFFKSRPSENLAKSITDRFRTFLNESLPEVLPTNQKIEIESNFDLSGPCLELKFPKPVEIQDWGAAYRSFLYSIDKELLPIDTFLGRRWVNPGLESDSPS